MLGSQVEPSCHADRLEELAVVAHHQQTSPPGGEYGFEGGETDEVQVLGWVVEHQQFRSGPTASETDEGGTHAFAGAERRQGPTC